MSSCLVSRVLNSTRWFSNASKPHVLWRTPAPKSFVNQVAGPCRAMCQFVASSLPSTRTGSARLSARKMARVFARPNLLRYRLARLSRCGLPLISSCASSHVSTVWFLWWTSGGIASALWTKTVGLRNGHIRCVTRGHFFKASTEVARSRRLFGLVPPNVPVICLRGLVLCKTPPLCCRLGSSVSCLFTQCHLRVAATAV